MANPILIKRSSVAAKVPATTDLQLGEMAINTNDGKLYMLKNNGTAAVIEIGPVYSVAGRTGAIVLSTTDVSEGTNLYFTNARASAAAPVQSVAGRTGAVTLAVADVSGAAPIASPTFTGTTTATAVNTTGLDTNGASVRMKNGGYGAILRNDGSNTWFLLTNSADADGSWNALRPLQINNATGAINLDTTGAGVITGGAFTAKTVNVGVNAAVAAAGTTQATGTVLATSVNVVTTGTGGVVLPTGVAGALITVINTTGSAINVYPASGAQIDALGANVAFSLGTVSKLEFVAISATQWYALTAVYA